MGRREHGLPDYGTIASSGNYAIPDLTTASRWLEAFDTSGSDRHDTKLELDASITNQVLDIISENGDSIPLICQRYFTSIDVWLTVISREDFEDQMSRLQAHPSSESALLLLCMQVVTCLPLQGNDARRYYFPAKWLFNTLSSDPKHSLRIVQAGLLLSLFEFGSDLVESAQVTIAVCSQLSSQLLLDPSVHRKDGVENTELGMTWWGISLMQT